MSTVIKTDGSCGPVYGVHATAFNFEDLAEHADKYLVEVRAQAAQIIARANQEAEQVRIRAEREGRQMASEAALSTVEERVEQRLTTLVPAMESAISGIQETRAQCLRHWETRVIELAAGIAGRILRRELDHDQEITPKLIRETLELAAGDPHVRLHLNPQDHERLRDRLPGIFRDVGTSTTPEIVADPSVGPGGCVVKTEFGEIDQTIEAQLDRIQQELTP